MTPESLVPSLELCKRLRELGYPQEGSVFYWVRAFDEWGGKEFNEDLSDKYWLEQEKPEYNKDFFAAPTVGELGEALPWTIETRMAEQLTCIKSPSEEGKWLVGYDTALVEMAASANTEADARAKMLCYLLENKLITPQGKERA